MATCANSPKHRLQSKPETMNTVSNLLLLFTSCEKRRQHIFNQSAATQSPSALPLLPTKNEKVRNSALLSTSDRFEMHRPEQGDNHENRSDRRQWTHRVKA